jgi:DNA-binding SARP family transcriptional activator
VGTEFGLLGDVQARVGGRLVDLGHARQQCVLVALLVDANRAVSTDQLIERVWADRAPQRARDTLYGYLHRLRRILDVADDVQIARQAGGYRLTVDPLAVDLHRFRDLAAHARTGEDDAVCLDRWERALELWRGEAFAGLDSLWINGLRDSLNRERLGAELDCCHVRTCPMRGWTHSATRRLFAAVKPGRREISLG